MNNRYRAEKLFPNGLISVYDYKCQWTATFNADGTFRHGNFRLPASYVLELLEGK